MEIVYRAEQLLEGLSSIGQGQPPDDNAGGADQPDAETPPQAVPGVKAGRPDAFLGRPRTAIAPPFDPNFILPHPIPEVLQ